MISASPSPKFLPTPPAKTQVSAAGRGSGWLQRKCACGGTPGPTGECEECRKKREAGLLQRKVDGREASGLRTEVPPLVHEVLGSPGQALNDATRSFMEPRFGHDFSQVRVHTDARAAASAQAVDALAYTVGNDVVFSSGQYAPQSTTGRWLLGHELAHVVQQSRSGPTGGALRMGEASDPSEHAADQSADAVNSGATPARLGASAPSSLRRKATASTVHCTAGAQGAPANNVAILSAADERAMGLAGAAAVLAEVGAAAATMDIPVGSSGVGRSYQDRFGLPPAARGGFMNRLTGRIAPTQNEAISGELDLLSTRLQLIADAFGQNIHYKCIDGPTTFMGCNCDCTDADACACSGISAIFLCPGFWPLAENGKATLLIHEAAHMIWPSVKHAGGYRDASCYANFVADIFNAPLTGPACPTP